MLTIKIPMSEAYDESTQEFVTVQSCTLDLEHSLVSLSKWEQTFEKPFLGSNEKSPEETLGYIKCMVLTPDFSPEVFNRLSRDNVQTINDYINRKFTATWFNDAPGAQRNREVVTAEIIYWWMFELDIPMECQHWHLNRLLTQIKVVNLKRTPPKHMTQAEAMAEQRRLNAMRRQSIGTRG